MITKPVLKQGTAGAVRIALAGVFLFGASAAQADLSNDKNVLTKFYTAAGGTTALSKWLQDDQVCDWEGVSCDCEENGDASGCTDEGSVTGLSLAGRNLTGTITPDLGNLSGLTHLALYSNKLTGEIPESLASLPGLKELRLDNNMLSGEVPEAFGNSTSLDILLLQSNKLTGDVDFLQTLKTNGADVKLNYNGFYGDIVSETGNFETIDAEVLNVTNDNRTAQVTWQPVNYRSNAGGYIVEFLDTDGKVFLTEKVAGKAVSQHYVDGLTPGTTYTVIVKSYTSVHDNNQNEVISDGKLYEGFEITMDDSDSDGDGIGDTMEGAHLVPPTDSDSDGIPDYLDQDDDNDGVPTSQELPVGLDTDGDGVPNYRDNDDDGDGKPTAMEIQLADTDIDDDDIESYLDNDDDGDTILTINELDEDRDGDNLKNWLDADDDGDGFMTIDELPETNDEDGDGLTDYLDAYEEEAVLGESGEVETVVTSRGGGAMGGSLALLALAGLGRKTARRRAAMMVALLSAGVGSAQAADQMTSASADADDKGVLSSLKDKLTPKSSDGLSDERAGRFYVGVSAGLTKLDPETRETTHTVSDGDDFGAMLTLGYEVSDNVAVEMFAANLGTADLEPTADVDYSNFGVGVALNPVGTAGGFLPLLRLGINRISNQSSGVEYQREEDYLGYASLGLEYEFDNAFSVRGAYDYFAEDAQMIHVGVFKHFGGAPPAPVVVNTPAPAPQPVIVRTEMPAPAPAPTPQVIVKEMPAPIMQIPDSDGDGVSDLGDKCPNSPPGAEIDEYGCAKFQGVLRGVNFEYDSARLTPNAMRILDEVAAELVKFPDVKVEVQAHTDSRGTDDYNQRLSQRRAQSVLNYLAQRKVSTARLLPIGYGERRPIATNETDSGRAQNRRVEFQVRK